MSELEKTAGPRIRVNAFDRVLLKIFNYISEKHHFFCKHFSDNSDVL